MTTIKVPSIVPAPAVPWGAYLGLGTFSILLVAASAWVAADSGDPSLWAVFAVITLIVGASIGSAVSTHFGRAGRIRLTRRRGCWAALGSRTGQLLLLTASVLTVLIATGFIIAMPESHPLLWGLGLAGVFGVVEGALRLREPIGWYFDQHMVMITVPRKGSTAFTWDEVEGVDVKRRGVDVTGLGHTVEVNGGSTASDPAVVARVIEFYRTNAPSRPELSDDRFLDRLRSGQL